jgi:hypothetical protein
MFVIHAVDLLSRRLPPLGVSDLDVLLFFPPNQRHLPAVVQSGDKRKGAMSLLKRCAMCGWVKVRGAMRILVHRS